MEEILSPIRKLCFQFDKCSVQLRFWPDCTKRAKREIINTKYKQKETIFISL